MLQYCDPSQYPGFDFDKDYGTPPSPSETPITLHIDGVEVTVPEGTSVMRAIVQYPDSETVRLR